MHPRDFELPNLTEKHRGVRRHRFMESADINAAFLAVFAPLRSNIRRGRSIGGQIFAIEMDACIPGELLGTSWIPAATYGIADPEVLADEARRQALFARLLAERRAEALFAYICERIPAAGEPLLYVEIVSADGRYAAEHPIVEGGGWHLRELHRGAHRRLGPSGMR